MKMSLRQTLAFCISMTALSAQAAKPPAWTQGTDRAYPESKYLIGVGIGADLDGARAGARGEIARTLQARVQQTVTDVQTESSASVGKKRGPAVGTQATTLNTQVSAEALLEGVVIRETYYNKKTKKHYALAVLDKMEARRALSTQIADKEQAVSSAVAEASNAALPADRVRALSRGLTAARERDVLAARRRLIDPAGMADLSGNTTANLDMQIRQALAALPVSLTVQAPEGSTLAAGVKAAITGLGLSVVTSAPALQVTAALTVEPFPRGDPQWIHYRWAGSVTVTDVASGKDLASSSKEDYDGHLVDATARTKARTAGEEALAQETTKLLSGILFGQ